MGSVADPRRLRLAVRVVGLGFVLAIVLGVVSMFGTERALGAATTMTIISGDIQVRHGAGSFAPADDGQLLTAGDTIRTGDAARAVLTYFEGSTVTLEPNTEVTIEDASTLTDGSTIVVILQNFGRTWHVVTKLVTGNSKYDVKTPASTASVRGTTFTVDVVFEDSVPVATVATTEGTVIHSAPDPQVPSKVRSERVTAGTAERIKKGEKPSPIVLTPEPKRRTTIEVGAANSLVVDPLGRTNGFTRDGRRVIQTPGAQVKRDGDRVIIVLPDLPDGKVVAHVDRESDRGDDADVSIHTTIEERGKAPVKLEDKIKPGSAGNQATGTDSNAKDPAPKASDPKKAADAPKATDRVPDPPKTPRVTPALPATPKPTENKSNANRGSQTNRSGSGQSSGSDPKSKDNGK
jgi:hypothetical protein